MSYQEHGNGGQTNGKKLYVGGLSYSTDEQSLGDLFAQSGTVESALIIVDRDTGRSKGFAFVEMSSVEEAQRAIAANHGQEFEGRTLTVTEAKPQQPRTGGFGGDRGNFRGDRGGNRGGERRGGDDRRGPSRSY